MWIRLYNFYLLVCLRLREYYTTFLVYKKYNDVLKEEGFEKISITAFMRGNVYKVMLEVFIKQKKTLKLANVFRKEKKKLEEVNKRALREEHGGYKEWREGINKWLVSKDRKKIIKKINTWRMSIECKKKIEKLDACLINIDDNEEAIKTKVYKLQDIVYKDTDIIEQFKRIPHDTYGILYRLEIIIYQTYPPNNPFTCLKDYREVMMENMEDLIQDIKIYIYKREEDNV